MATLTRGFLRGMRGAQSEVPRTDGLELDEETGHLVPRAQLPAFQIEDWLEQVSLGAGGLSFFAADHFPDGQTLWHYHKVAKHFVDAGLPWVPGEGFL